MLKDRDQYDSEAFETFYVPLNFFQNFKPVNLEVKSHQGEFGAKPVFYLTLCMQK